ncbi:MAG: CocE/NonD family hydrolase [Acidobacteria bacterium]|nr:CocE/NonD family hydrolase [Acidobacteriota bacterium]
MAHPHVVSSRPVVLAGLLAASLAPAQVTIKYIREHYAKHEYRIAMRDGQKLFTSVYVPKNQSRKYPILLLRTPYCVPPYGADLYRARFGGSDKLAEEGYIFAYQDVRGRCMSEGDFVDIRPHKPVKSGPQDIDESTDTFDTIDWLVKNVPANNGRVGIWGISYPGFYAAAGIIDAHPALKCASPQAPIGDTYMGDDSFHNGAFMLGAIFRFFSFFAPRKGGPAPPVMPGSFEVGGPDAYDFFLRLGPLSNAEERHFKRQNPHFTAHLEHTAYDEHWRSRAIVHHLNRIKPAVMTVGGWFDAEDLAGPLGVYRKIEQSSPGAVNFLVMGPWTHGGWGRSEGERVGNVQFGAKTSVFYRDLVEKPFFDYFLKDQGEGKFAEAYVFETGANAWHQLGAWPPRNFAAKTLYFAEGGKLSMTAPSADGFDEYVSDPAKPVPYLNRPGGPMNGDYMTEDQRFAAARPDVLVYQTDPLEADFTIAGPVTAALHVSTSGTDSDFVVKLIDVYPSGYTQPPGQTYPLGSYQQLVRGEPFRGKFRNSFSKPEPFKPGKLAKVQFDLPDVYHTFRRGHRVMVQIQSSWFPLTDRNPQKFLDIPKATAADFQKATQRVYRRRAAASSITVLARP